MPAESRTACITVAFAAGILAAAFLSPVAFALACTCTAVVALLVFRKRWDTAVVLLGFFVLGAIRYTFATDLAANDLSRFHQRVSGFQGTVVSDPESSDGRVRFVVEVARAQVQDRWVQAAGSVLVSVYCADHPGVRAVHYGNRVHVSASPYIPIDPTNPGRFSWRAYLARQGIRTCASIRSPGQLKVLPGKSGNPLVAAAVAAKRAMERAVYRTHGSQEAPLVTGIVLGSYAYLPPETLRSFSRTGTLHILAASGFNCYVLVLLATWLLTRLRFPRWRVLIIVVLIGAYLLIVGPKPSLFRASVMAVLALFALPLRRAPNASNIFFTAAFVVLMVTPTHLFDAGFQLSFLAVWALISSAPFMSAILRRFGIGTADTREPGNYPGRTVKRATGTVITAAVGTAAITLYTAPVIAYYFNYFSLVSVPANVSIVFGVPAMFAAGLAALPASFFPVAGEAVGIIGTIITRAVLACVTWLGSHPWSALSVVSPAPTGIVGYYLLLLAGISWGRSRYGGY